MAVDLPQRLATLEANHNNLKEDVVDMKEELKNISDYVTRQKGAAPVVMFFSNIAGGGILFILHYFFH